MDQCDFCDREVIIKQKIYEDDFIIAIYPQKPIIFHHIMIFPKRHHQIVSEMTPKEIVKMSQFIQRIFNIFKKKYDCIGYNLISNNGSPKVGQTVPHCHLHVYLRFEKETISPYKVMNDISLRETLTPEDWKSRKDQLSEIINKNEI